MIDFARWKYPLAALVALSQTAVLGYMVESRAQILRNGQEVILQTEPVDPRDLLRGDYVILGYEISRMPAAYLKGQMPADRGENPVYIALRMGAHGYWIPSRASWQPIADIATDETLIVGHTPDYFSATGEDTIPLTYGIERYYVPEGEGMAIEAGQAQKAVKVAVAVDKTGRAQIKSLSLDGKTLYAEPLY
ncbi:MAG: GDYXXLXY domain-containing protein [Rhizobiaceae bacterium]